MRNPTKGDWPELVKKDLIDLNLNYSFKDINHIWADLKRRTFIRG